MEQETADYEALRKSFGIKNMLTARDKRAIPGLMKYPGSKFDSLQELLPLLPYRGAWIDVFAGSGTVTLSRNISKLEVMNDRYGGVIHFYRMVTERLDDLVARLELTVHSRELFEEYKSTWNKITDPIEMAARWYYMTQYAFLGKGVSFGRVIKPTSPVAGTIRAKLPRFEEIHIRLAQVQMENLDWRDILREYDQKDAVFYLDPPYYGVDCTSYEHKMTKADHREMCGMIMGMKGFVALSGYDNELYNSFKWTKIHRWERRDRANAIVDSVYANKDASATREMVTETLWIKE